MYHEIGGLTPRLEPIAEHLQWALFLTNFVFNAKKYLDLRFVWLSSALVFLGGEDNQTIRVMNIENLTPKQEVIMYSPMTELGLGWGI